MLVLATCWLLSHTWANKTQLSKALYPTTMSVPFQGSNRNITMDNWFTTIPLANALLKDPYNMTLLGTIRLDNPKIPLNMRLTKNREIGDSKFLFSNNTTLLSYKAKKNKVVCLLSTMHPDKGVNQNNNKPFMIEHYNQTKGGVDTMDQMCSVRSCSRKTKRWPLCIFYDLVNIGGVNSLIILNRVLCSKNKPPLTRKLFLNQLYQQLAYPWLEQRLSIRNLPRDLRSMILSVLHRTETADIVRPREKKRTTCKICPSEKRRMTTNYCNKCDAAFCAEHRGDVCKNCCA